MEQIIFDKLLLKTAFSCMACDGDIDKREIVLIKTMHQNKKIFGDIDINLELDNLLLEINRDGHQFLKSFFSELKSSSLSEQNELKLIEANEKGEVNTVQSIITELGFLSLSELADIEIQAIGWANRIGEAVN